MRVTPVQIFVKSSSNHIGNTTMVCFLKHFLASSGLVVALGGGDQIDPELEKGLVSKFAEIFSREPTHLVCLTNYAGDLNFNRSAGVVMQRVTGIYVYHPDPDVVVSYLTAIRYALQPVFEQNIMMNTGNYNPAIVHLPQFYLEPVFITDVFPSGAVEPLINLADHDVVETQGEWLSPDLRAVLMNQPGQQLSSWYPRVGARYAVCFKSKQDPAYDVQLYAATFDGQFAMVYITQLQLDRNNEYGYRLTREQYYELIRNLNTVHNGVVEIPPPNLDNNEAQFDGFLEYAERMVQRLL